MVGFLGMIPFRLTTHGGILETGWLCDWYCSVPGLGLFLLQSATQRLHYLFGVGGSNYSLPIFSRFARAQFATAVETYYLPIRLSPVLEKVGKYVPLLGLDRWTRLGELPLPTSFKTMRISDVEVEPGVPDSIAPLFEARPADLHPWFDLSHVQWQIGRCPELRAWTCQVHEDSTATAAVVLWHAKDSAHSWRFFLASRPGATRELHRALDAAIRHVRRAGGHLLTIVVSRNDYATKAVLRGAHFVKARESMPLFIFASQPAKGPLEELREFNYLCSDLAYRFLPSR